MQNEKLQNELVTGFIGRDRDFSIASNDAIDLRTSRPSHTILENLSRGKIRYKQPQEGTIVTSENHEIRANEGL